MTNTTLQKATRNFQRAAACGDIDEAIHWMEILLEHMHAIRSRVIAPKPVPRPHRMKAETGAARRSAPPTMPVMLDPDGFSPGGTPNWFLNLQRHERAGLPSTQAPLTKAALRGQQNPTNT